MLKTVFTKRNIIFVLSAIVLFGMIGFVENKESEREVNNVIIHIRDGYGNHFVDENDISRIITLNNTDNLRGKYYHEVNLKEMEKNIRQNKFVEEAEVFKDHKGNILINVVQHRPIARVAQEYGPHAYISDKGTILPVSDKFAARVVVVDGERAGRLLDSVFIRTDEAKAFISMIRMIEKDPFFKAQISQISFRKNGDLELRPQVGDEVILFGKPEDLEEKFRKVKIFYKNIVQLRGFNKYKIVNLKYKDQIICE